MKVIFVESCDKCPYNTGWDPMLCMEGESLFCGFERLTTFPNITEDKEIGCFDRSKPVPIPDWCPLPEQQTKRALVI